ncbi:MAG: SPOR domain-containing protein [Proteobacteria bacterium]|nr:SPOR domain-containing protein [Pseudomonadota bacterium]
MQQQNQGTDAVTFHPRTSCLSVVRQLGAGHIRPTVFQNGSPVFTFDVAGLESSKIGFKPPPFDTYKKFAVRISVFSNSFEANKLCTKLRSEDFHCNVIEYGAGTAKLYTVQVGPANSRDEAELIRNQIKTKTQLPAIIVLYQK